MPAKRYARELLTKIINDREESARRWTPLKAQDLDGEPLVHVLSDLVTSWPPRDIRLDPVYKVSHPVESIDSEHMEMIARGMEVRVTRKNLQTNTLSLAVDFQSNLDEYEAYNEKVRTHNERWENQGRPEDVFNPVTGDLLPLKDTYVDPAIPTSKHDPIPQSFFENKSSGTIANNKPTPKRNTYVKLTYKISLNDDTFTLEYAAKNTKNHILLHNTITGNDLNALVRSSIQQLWGNTEFYGNKGPLLNGISMLLKGKKKHLNNTPRPEWLKGHTKPAVTLDEVTVSINKTGSNIGHVIFGYIIPIIAGISIISIIINTLIGAYLDGKSMSGYFFGGLLIISIIAYVSLKIGGACLDKAAAAEQEEALL